MIYTYANSPMYAPISTVVEWRTPAKMFWSAAAKMALPARMQSQMIRGWWRAIYRFTNKAVNSNALFDLAIAATNTGVWPKNAVIAIISQDDFIEESSCFTGRYSTCQGVSVLPPSFVMVAAPATGMWRLVAFLNRAYGIGSHSSLLFRFVGSERVEAGMPLTRSLFYKANLLRDQQQMGLN